MPAAGAIQALEVALVEWSTVPFVERQTFFDGKVDWTFYARRREWIGIDRVADGLLPRRPCRDADASSIRRSARLAW